MLKTRFMAFAFIGVAACVGTSISSGSAPLEAIESAPPNIILLQFDGMSSRVDSLGDPIARTSNFDRIAAEGVRYTNVLTTSGVCAPSRAALITGQYQQADGVQHIRTSVTHRRSAFKRLISAAS